MFSISVIYFPFNKFLNPKINNVKNDDRYIKNSENYKNVLPIIFKI